MVLEPDVLVTGQSSSGISRLRIETKEFRLYAPYEAIELGSLDGKRIEASLVEVRFHADSERLQRQPTRPVHACEV